MPGSEMFSSASMPKPPGIWPIPTLPVMLASGQGHLGLAGDELQRAQEASRVTGGEQLFRVGAVTGAAQFLEVDSLTSSTPSEDLAEPRPPVAVAVAVYRAFSILFEGMVFPFKVQVVVTLAGYVWGVMPKDSLSVSALQSLAASLAVLLMLRMLLMLLTFPVLQSSVRLRQRYSDINN
jgi:hypothetical protein